MMNAIDRNYSAWAQASQKQGLGVRLKNWVDRTYLGNIKRALGGRENPSILEIGPGNGEFAHVAMAEGFRYSSIERSPELAEKLVTNGIDCVHADFPADIGPVAGQRFSCVYLSHVLEHQDTRGQAVDFVGGVAGLLEPGGVVVINCPNALSHGMLFWASDYTHNFVTTPLRVRNLLVDQGFEIVLERRMRFGFQSAVPRAIVAFAGLFVRPALLKPIARLLVRDYDSDPRIYFRENFTTVARLPE